MTNTLAYYTTVDNLIVKPFIEPKVKKKIIEFIYSPFFKPDRFDASKKIVYIYKSV
jgi:hypothetical protein